MTAYAAKGLLRNGHTNSVLAGSPARKLVVQHRHGQFQQQAKKEIIHAGDDIRLAAVFNLQNQSNAPTVILLHGWLGCADSLYLISLGDFLYQNGFNVVRLNFRDHGDSHALNAELFHSCRIQEVIDVCISIQQMFPDAPMSLIGFSLGGNFALRVNALTSAEQLNIYRTIAFCPVIDPLNTLIALENSFLVYRNYFMQRWKVSFNKKVASFPHLYSKETFKSFHSLRDATENLATHYAGFDSLESYLTGYSIAGNRLSTLHAPSQVILAKDDPIIPWQDQNKLASSKQLDIYLSEHGGHCGFLAADLTSPWIDQFTLEYLASAT